MRFSTAAPALFLGATALEAFAAGPKKNAAPKKTAPPKAASIRGDWRGSLNAGGATLRLVFHLQEGAAGALSGKLDSLDQGVSGIPLGGSLQSSSVRLTIPSAGGTYVGALNSRRTEIVGTWTQAGHSMPLALKRGVAALAAPKPKPHGKRTSPLEGDWQGRLAAGGASLRIAFHFSRTKSGAFLGTMDSLDQGAKGIPLNDIRLTQRTVSLEAKGIGGSYRGELDPQGKRISGTWSQAGGSYPLHLEKR
jgi:hypothetical protein